MNTPGRGAERSPLYLLTAPLSGVEGLDIQMDCRALQAGLAMTKQVSSLVEGEPSPSACMEEARTRLVVARSVARWIYSRLSGVEGLQ